MGNATLAVAHLAAAVLILSTMVLGGRKSKGGGKLAIIGYFGRRALSASRSRSG